MQHNMKQFAKKNAPWIAPLGLSALLVACYPGTGCSSNKVHAQTSQTGPAISASDRVYTADQTSNTVSVIDPLQNKLLGVIPLGGTIPKTLSPLYRGPLLVHGLGFSPDHKTLVVVAVGSNSVIFIDTDTNKVKGTLFVGRSPHEAFFTPDGSQVWTTVRGLDYISVADAVTMKEVRRVQVADGPGMTMFSPDGKFAFIVSSFTPEVDVVDTSTYQVIAKVPQASSFSPNIAVSADGLQFWICLKDVGKTQVFSALPPFNQIALLDTGPITNHVNLVDNKLGKFAYVTVGGLNEVKVFTRDNSPKLVATIPVGPLPHGIWPSGDGSRVYVALENGGMTQVIDTLSNQVIANIPIGQTSQALVYVPGASPSQSAANLVPLSAIQTTDKINMVAAAGSPQPQAKATVSIDNQGILDLLEIAAVGLAPKTDYFLYVVDSPQPPFKTMTKLALLTTNPDGGVVGQAIGPLKQVATSPAAGQDPSRQYLLVTPTDSTIPVLLQ